MAIKTQIKVAQLTGSIPSSAESATAATSIVANDLGKVLDHMASSIKRIHGGSDFSGQAAGQFDLVNATTLQIGGVAVTATAAELNKLDDLTTTTAELNIMDGDTSATSTTLADADRVVVNDAGTMKQVALTDFETYFESALDTLSNVTTVGALNAGSITSGFGSIDIGSSTITTTGKITGGELDIDDVVINGSTIGHTDDTDLITLANGVATVAGEISVTTLDIGGTNVSATAAELNYLDNDDLTAADLTKLAAIDASAAELNIMDGDTSASSVTLVDADRVVVNDAGTMKQVALSDFETYFEAGLDTLSGIIKIGNAQDSDAIVLKGSESGITPGEVQIRNLHVVNDAYIADQLAVSGSAKVEGDIKVSGGSGSPTVLDANSLVFTPSTDDTVTIAGAANGALNITTVDGGGSGAADITVQAQGHIELKASDGGTGILFEVSSEDQVKITDGYFEPVTDSDVELGLSGKRFKKLWVDDVDVSADVTIAGNLTVQGTTTQVDTTNLQVKDKNILVNDGGSTAGSVGAGIDIEGDSAAVVGYMRVGSSDNSTLEFKAPGNAGVLTVDINATETLTVAGSLNVEADSNINQDVTTDATPTFNSIIATAGMADRAQGGVYLHDSDNSAYVRLRAPSDVSANVTLTLPDNDGDSGQVLLTDGSGNLSFGAPTAGSVAADDIAVGDANVTIKTSANGGVIALQADNNGALVMTSSMGIKMNPGMGGVRVDSPKFDNSMNVNLEDAPMGGFLYPYNHYSMTGVETWAANHPDYHGRGHRLNQPIERFTVNGTDYLYLSASAGVVKFVGEAEHGLSQPYLHIMSSSTGQAILSGTNLILDADDGALKFADRGVDKLMFELSDAEGVLFGPAGGADLVFFDMQEDAEIARFDVSANSLKMEGNNKIEFRDTNSFIHSNGSNELTAGASSNITLDAGGAIFLDATTSGGPSIFFADAGAAGTTLDWQPSNSGDWSVEVAAQNKDLQFKVDDGGTVRTVASMVGSGASFRMSSGRKLEFGSANLSITDASGDMVIDSSADIILDADGANVTIKDGGTTTLDIVSNGTTDVTFDAPGDIILDAGGMDVKLYSGGSSNNYGELSDDGSGNFKIGASKSDKHLIFQVNDGGSPTEVFRLEGDDSAMKMGNGKHLRFGADEEYIYGDTNDLILESGRNILAMAPVVINDTSAGGLAISDIGSSTLPTPSSGYGVFFVKGDTPYFKNDSGTEFNLTTATVTGSHPMKVQYTVPSTVSAGSALTINSGSVDYANWIAAGGHGCEAPAFVDVFVNGQLLVSGGHGSTENADYVLVQDGATLAASSFNQIKFAFGLEVDDVVTVKRIRQS